jgi:cyclopropane-fatty-acyl-phospholipid synthase
VTSTQQVSTGVIDPVKWPDVAAVRGSAARAEIARALFRTAVSRLPVRVRLPGGRELGAGSAAAPVMVVHNPSAF